MDSGPSCNESLMVVTVTVAEVTFAAKDTVVGRAMKSVPEFAVPVRTSGMVMAASTRPERVTWKAAVSPPSVAVGSLATIDTTAASSSLIFAVAEVAPTIV